MPSPRPRRPTPRHLGAALALTLAFAAAGSSCNDSDVSRLLGARCDDNDECDERCLRPGTSYPGGFCTLSCDTDSDCPDGARCVAADGGICLFACDADPECAFLGDGWSCLASVAHPDGEVEVCTGR